ncbi:MAG TPA: hypothetical protein VGB37_01585 [Candidatus Lokiarchaeia archaeon]
MESKFNNNINTFKSFKNGKHFDLRRIHSIDILKGLSICIIILINTAEFWIESKSIYYYALISIYLDLFGTILFIFLFSISVIFLWKKKMGINPSREIRNDILIRGFLLICSGIAFNIIIFFVETKNIEIPSLLNLWGWNILVFAGFAQIISYYAVKLSRGARWIVGFLIFFASTPIRDGLILLKNISLTAAIIHYIIVSPNPQVTILPYVAICFFSTIFGERILDCLQLNVKQCDLDTFKSMMIIGALFTLIGLYYGWAFIDPTILDPDDYPMVKLVPILKGKAPFFIMGIQGYLIRGTAPNLLFGFGTSLIVLGVSFYLFDIKHIHNFFVRILIFYGQCSLSLVFIHCIGLVFFNQFFGLIYFFIAYFIYISLLGFLMLLWVKYGKGIGTLKWIMAKLGSRHK